MDYKVLCELFVILFIRLPKPVTPGTSLGPNYPPPSLVYYTLKNNWIIRPHVQLNISDIAKEHRIRLQYLSVTVKFVRMIDRE